MADYLRIADARWPTLATTVLVEFIGVLLGGIFRVPIALFQNAGQLVFLAFDHPQVVVGQFSPLLFDLAFLAASILRQLFDDSFSSS